VTRRRLALLFLPAGLLLALAAVFAWLLHTEAGARWVWARATAAVPGLQAQVLSGDLASGLELQGLTYFARELSLTADRVRLRLAIGLLPPGLVVASLDAGRLDIRRGATAPVGAPADRAATLASLRFALPIRFERVTLRTLALHGAEPNSALEMHDLAVSGRWQERLDLHSMRLRYRDVRLKSTARLELAPPFALLADFRTEMPGAGLTAEGAPLAFQVRLEGDLASLRVTASAENADIRIDGEFSELLRDPQWDLALQSEQLQLLAGETMLQARQLTVASSGSPADYRFELAAGLAVTDLTPLQLAAAGSGTLQGLAIEDARLGNDAGDLTATGTVHWAQDARVAATVTTDGFDPRPWITDWPGAHPLHGSFTLEWAGEQVRLPHIRLAARGTAFELDGRAELDPAADRVSATLVWRDFAWPLGAAEPAFASRSGALELTGRPDDWTAQGRVRLQAAGVPEGELRLSARGDRESLQAEIDQGAILGGSFEGRFDYRWAESPAWSARVTAHALQTDALLPDYPGVISGRVDVRARTEPDEIDIRIEALEGMIRNRPVQADGRVLIAQGMLRAEALAIRSGSSGIRLDGNPRGPEGLRFDARIESLADFLDDAQGSAEGRGRLALDAAQPRLELELEARNLAWGDWRAASLTAHPNGLPGGDGHELQVTDAAIGDYPVDELRLSWGGRTPLEHIRAEARIRDTQLNASLAGGVQDWSRPLASGWHGRLEALRANHETLGRLELRTPVALSAGSSAARLEPACFVSDHDGAICLRADWQADSELAAHADLEGISLDLIRLFAATNAAFSQRLTGSLEWRKPAGGDPTGEVRIHVSPGELSLPDDEEAVLRTGAGILQFDIRDGQLLAGDFDLPIIGGGGIDIDFGIPDLSRGAASPVQARIRVELSDIAPIVQLFPALDRVEGQISADLRVGGTLSAPVLTGHATLVRGRIEHVATGLVLSEIQLAGAVYEHGFTELNGTFHAGDGRGRIKATVGFGDMLHPEVTLELTGHDLLLVNVPDMRLVADPDLSLAWQGGPITVDGRIKVSSARLSPRYLPTATVTESADLVIVGGPEPEVAEPVESRLRLNGSVEVILGEDVSAKLDRATARVEGTVVFHWEDQLMPTGDGSFTVTGEVQAYGQLLRISEGRIRFARKPANNPSLDIRAEREIYGNRQIKRAGVRISGTLKRPVLETYTEPMTTQERALTLLVTGNDFDYEQGVGGVEVGMYVAPKLYFSYGIGLFDNQNVISARYDLKKGFGVKATSGQRETGVDISYTIED
jgi:translocation and assembly module TamB